MCDCRVFYQGDADALVKYGAEINQGFAIYFDRNDGQYVHVPPYGTDTCAKSSAIGGFTQRIEAAARKIY